MKTYLLIYDESIREKTLLSFLDSRKEILDWMTFLPSSVFLMSRHSLQHLTTIFRRKYPQAQFLITEIETERTDGMLPEECWEFINE